MRQVRDGDEAAGEEFRLAMANQWEWAKSWLGMATPGMTATRLTDAEQWEALIPHMQLMSLTRNLRGFDQAGVSDEVAATVAAKLADQAQVAKSRQLPMRFLSAYRNAPSDRWKWPLTQAVNAALANVPELPGRTLILVDTSSSMQVAMSDRSGLMRWDAAALFGCALASRCASVDLVSFSSGRRYYHDTFVAHQATKVYDLRSGESLLAMVDRWGRHGYFLGGGTETEAALQQHYAGHDRVVVLTDEQAHGHVQVGSAIPNTPIYTLNLAGYAKGHAPSGSYNRHVFGGLSDNSFKLITMIEAGVNGHWPWETPVA
jgi:hypothetical protein